MLSRFYLTRTFKGITLFVLMSFMFSSLIGCSETKVTNTETTSNVRASESLVKTASTGSEQRSDSAEKDNSTPIKKGLFVASEIGDEVTESPPPPPYLVTDGPELQLLLGLANGNPTVSYAKASLIAGGYYYAPSSAIGARDHYAGSEIVFLPFGVFPTPMRPPI